MPPVESHPELIVLHHVKLKGFPSSASLVPGTGLPEPEVITHLDGLKEQGLVMYREGRISGYTLTPAGREEHKSRLRGEASDHREHLRGHYAEFLILNGELLAVCTAWQVRDLSTNEMNDHLDSDYDDGVRARLSCIHDGVAPICGELAGRLRRYSTYHGRFEEALAKVHQGLNEWFARPIIDSYHTVWMELHEDLLATLEIDRASEPSH